MQVLEVQGRVLKRAFGDCRGLRVQGYTEILGFRAWVLGLGFRIQGLGFRI